MVGLDTNNGTTGSSMVDLQVAVARALESGATMDDILSMIELRVAGNETAFQGCMPGFHENDQDTVFVELPEGLIDLPSATRKYNVNPSTLHSWVKKGHVRLRGRLKGPAHGGGFLLVREEDVTAYLTAPRRKGGRPPLKKGGAALP